METNSCNSFSTQGGLACLLVMALWWQRRNDGNQCNAQMSTPDGREKLGSLSGRTWSNARCCGMAVYAVPLSEHATTPAPDRTEADFANGAGRPCGVVPGVAELNLEGEAVGAGADAPRHQRLRDEPRPHRDVLMP